MKYTFIRAGNIISVKNVSSAYRCVITFVKNKKTVMN